ncbi:MAG TPA: hypothetical protein DCQ31_14495 [Bacteroidales bacterium]|nr:hypothetical protein [Bacteroidales bacterium]
MNFLELRNEFFDRIYFSNSQIFAVYPDFNKNNLTNWCKKGYLIKLKNGIYSFPEYKSKLAYAFYIANKLYRPSYISLHSALAYYELIPEAVVQITSVSSLKTNNFSNGAGDFSYKSIKPELMFGYIQKSVDKKVNFALASPEKAILDLLYLYNFYNTSSELEALRIDKDIFDETVNLNLLEEYLRKFNNKSLEARVEILLDLIRNA